MTGKHVVDAMMRPAAGRGLADLVHLGRRQREHAAEVREPPATRWSASDAVLLGDYPSPRTYGCFPVILGEYVREENYLSLPNAIRKMTSFPAQRLGIPDRGLLRDGFKADIVVFNPKTVKATATRAEPKQFPIGIEYVIVNGKVVVDQNVQNETLAGRRCAGAARPPDGRPAGALREARAAFILTHAS